MVEETREEQKKKLRADQTIGRESDSNQKSFTCVCIEPFKDCRTFNFNRIPRWLPAGFADKRPDPLTAFLLFLLRVGHPFFPRRTYANLETSLKTSLRTREIFNLTFDQLNFLPYYRANRSSVVINKIRADTRETNHFFHFEISAINLDCLARYKTRDWLRESQIKSIDEFRSETDDQRGS